MNLLTWAIRLVIFLFLAAFAIGNTDPVLLRPLPGAEWQAPLIVILLAFFVAGALFGVLSLVGIVLRQRRQIASLQKAQASDKGDGNSSPVA